jgi:hypothetical protein
MVPINVEEWGKFVVAARLAAVKAMHAGAPDHAAVFIRA